MLDADTRFLRRILMVLVAGTIATGVVAGITAVKTELTNRIATIASV
jgi:hypothetical protein